MFLPPRRKLQKSVNHSSGCESSSVLCAERQTSSLAGHENSRRMEALRAMLSWFVQGCDKGFDGERALWWRPSSYGIHCDSSGQFLGLCLSNFSYVFRYMELGWVGYNTAKICQVTTVGI
ncbi:hypothetical protein CY35_01G089500 [Sphagnum magellanicum]|nr:hypothetical protein CY35_01G089500 [Sphagnum magellanicum]